MGDIRAQANLLAADPTGNGVALFKAMFAAKPSWRAFFPKMKGTLSIDDAHATKVITRLIDIINSANPGAESTKLAKEHNGRGLFQDHFNEFAPILLAVLSVKLGNDFNEGAWRSFYSDIFLPNFFKGFKC